MVPLGAEVWRMWAATHSYIASISPFPTLPFLPNFIWQQGIIMAYQVLARSYRPQQLKEVVGQTPTLKILTHSLEQQRFHHAYLFTGKQGVGKTTLARILAKCLNCEKGISPTPCDECPSCIEIKEGRFVDLMEVDAASRTRVEETRELLENVQYLPTRGRYKIYLIDEVHMLSTHSFNALLKTLEEPPSHVLFLLATTDPQKLPVTILSRCLQLHLTPLSPLEIQTQLAHILQQENIPFEEKALSLLAEAAKGSVRDALSLLEQAIAQGEGQVTPQEVSLLLGLMDPQSLIPLVKALIHQDAAALLQESERLAWGGHSLSVVLSHLLHLFHDLSLFHALPDNTGSQPLLKEELRALAQQISFQDLQLFYQIGVMGQQELPFAPQEKVGFDMILLRMLAFQPKLNPPVVSPPPSSHQREPVKQTSLPKIEKESSSSLLPWETLLPQLKLKGLTHVLASHCILEKMEEDKIYLSIETSQGALVNPKQKVLLEEAFSLYFQKPMEVIITLLQENLATPTKLQQEREQQKLMEAERILFSDPAFQALQTHLEAEIEPGTVEFTD